MHICTNGVHTPSVLWCSCSFKVIQGGYTVRSVVLTCSRIAISNSIFAPFPNRSIQVHSETLFFLEISKTPVSRNCGFQRNNGISKRLLEIPDSETQTDWSIKSANNSIGSISTPTQCVGGSTFHSRAYFRCQLT